MITFDGATKRISLSIGTTTLSVRDLWSRWVDWFLTDDNAKYDIWMMQVGGDDIDEDAGTKIPIYIFLSSTVKIKPQEANHTLKVTDGILLVAGGGDPFVNTEGDYTVRINYQQPVQAISFSAEGGGGGGLSVEEHDELFSIRGNDGDNLKILSDKLDAILADLDNPDQYKANLAGLALEATAQLIKTEALKISSIQTETDKIQAIKTATDKIDDIKDKTDQLFFTAPGRVDATMGEDDGGLTPEEHNKVMSIPDIQLTSYIRNKKYLEKVGSTWYLVIRNDNDTSDILRKALKDRDGNDIEDIKVGILAQELKSLV